MPGLDTSFRLALDPSQTRAVTDIHIGAKIYTPIFHEPSILDFPPSLLNLVLESTTQNDLASLAKTCKYLYLSAVPFLWNHIKLDLTISETSSQNHLFDSKTSVALVHALAHGCVSPFALACIRQLSLNIGMRTSKEMVERFLGPRLLNPGLLKNVRLISFYGPTWANAEAIAGVMAGFGKQRHPAVIAIQDVSLACLAELVLPYSPINDKIKALSLNFSSLTNTASDIDLMSNLLNVCPQLRSFSLAFNYEFDLCEDPFLEARIEHVFRRMALNHPELGKIAIYDFPPYLHFNPQCLPPSVKEFVFHTNEIDSQHLFCKQLLAGPANLKSLSLRIAQSIDSNPIAIDTVVRLTTLQELTLDTPCNTELLACLVKANRQLSRLALSQLTTSGLCQLLHCRASLRHIYIYSFSSTCSPACPSLVITAVLSSHFPKLRLISLPPMPDAIFTRCVLLKQQRQLPHLSFILSNMHLTGIEPFSAALSPPGSPEPSSSSTSNPRLIEHQSPVQNSLHSSSLAPSQKLIHSHSQTPALTEFPLLSNNDRSALWTYLPFKSVDELDLFTFHTKNQVCVL